MIVVSSVGLVIMIMGIWNLANLKLTYYILSQVISDLLLFYLLFYNQIFPIHTNIERVLTPTVYLRTAPLLSMGNLPCLCGIPITCFGLPHYTTWVTHYIFVGWLSHAFGLLTVIMGSPSLTMWEAHYISKGSPTTSHGQPTMSL